VSIFSKKTQNKNKVKTKEKNEIIYIDIVLVKNRHIDTEIVSTVGAVGISLFGESAHI